MCPAPPPKATPLADASYRQPFQMKEPISRSSREPPAFDPDGPTRSRARGWVGRRLHGMPAAALAPCRFT